MGILIIKSRRKWWEVTVRVLMGGVNFLKNVTRKQIMTKSCVTERVLTWEKVTHCESTESNERIALV